MTETMNKPDITRWLSLPKGLDWSGRERDLPEGGIMLDGERFVVACDGATMLAVVNYAGPNMDAGWIDTTREHFARKSTVSHRTTLADFKSWIGEFMPFCVPHQDCAGKGCVECDEGNLWPSYDLEIRWTRRVLGVAVNANRVAQALHYIDGPESIVVGTVPHPNATHAAISIEAPGHWRAIVMGVQEGADTKRVPEWPERR